MHTMIGLSVETSEPKKPILRNQLFLVNRDFQLKYTKAAVGVGILSTALTAVIILYPLFTFEILRIPRFLPWPIFATMGVAAFVNIAFLAFMGVFMTHRIAGPMYSLVKYIRLVGMGQWNGQMRLRDDDELRYVVRNFNEMIKELRYMGEKDLNDLRLIKEKLNNLDCDEETKQKLLELEERMQARISDKTSMI